MQRASPHYLCIQCRIPRRSADRSAILLRFREYQLQSRFYSYIASSASGAPSQDTPIGNSEQPNIDNPSSLPNNRYRRTNATSHAGPSFRHPSVKTINNDTQLRNFRDSKDAKSSRNTNTFSSERNGDSSSSRFARSLENPVKVGVFPEKLRTDGHSNRYKKKKSSWPSHRSSSRPTSAQYPSYPLVNMKYVPAFFKKRASIWVTSPRTFDRIASFGVTAIDIPAVLNSYASAVQRGELCSPSNFEKYRLDRFTHQLDFDTIDFILSTVFFTWITELTPSAAKKIQITEAALTTLRRIAEAADRRRPSEEHCKARQFLRKVVMHVGPTNSGKTHHALRALAAAEHGVYAGPLRLLAHEIWERFNLGQIVPLGMDPETTPFPIKTMEAPTMFNDVKVGRTATKDFDPRFVRNCNMITGEEQKIVDVEAPILSCTVEMLNTDSVYDVAVVDEIQMIADPQRGGAWSNAVLGLCAKEIHLCGEETAVPLIEALMKETGDELEIRRYERLTPLDVEKQSLEGDYSKVKKGDCIITFSRSSIFAVKRQVEEKTGMRCAVVYGKLPPEIRSEQAALFNDSNSGYDVIIGSDAIGMGLNLKIRRIIFTDVVKMDGRNRTTPLSISSVKQIAGRAGRFGLHGDEAPGGFVTSLHAQDLPFIRRTIALPTVPLTHAYISSTTQAFGGMMNVLPANASTETIFNAMRYASHIPSHFRIQEQALLSNMSEFIDKHAKHLSVRDRVIYTMAPIQWRDPIFLEVLQRFMTMYCEDARVDFMAAIAPSNFLRALQNVETRMAGEGRGDATDSMLVGLERFHRSAVLYLWLSFRNLVAYPYYEDVAMLKTRLEIAMEWCLNALSKLKQETSVGDKEHLTDIVHSSGRTLSEANEKLQRLRC